MNIQILIVIATAVMLCSFINFKRVIKVFSKQKNYKEKRGK